MKVTIHFTVSVLCLMCVGTSCVVCSYSSSFPRQRHCFPCPFSLAFPVVPFGKRCKRFTYYLLYVPFSIDLMRQFGFRLIENTILLSE